MDEFELTTYIGRHVISQELRMVGEDYRVSRVCDKYDIRGTSALNIMTQDLFNELLDEDCIWVLDYKAA